MIVSFLLAEFVKVTVKKLKSVPLKKSVCFSLYTDVSMTFVFLVARLIRTPG